MTRPWLFFLGGRRPTSAEDQAEYAEILHDKATPEAGNLPAHVEGHSMGSTHRKGGRHRAHQ